MLERAHSLRERICTSRAFGEWPVLGVLLCKDTVEQCFGGRPVVEYLWEVQGVVPFLKVDRGVEEEHAGVQLMREIPDLDDIFVRAAADGIFGIKARSLIKQPDAEGIKAVVKQQLHVANLALANGLVPIIETEICVHCQKKAACERLLRDALLDALDTLADDELVMFRLTLPCEDNFYHVLAKHPNTLRVLALGGGLGQARACQMRARNADIAACLGRAFLEGLHVNQSQVDFESTLARTCRAMMEASRAGLALDYSSDDLEDRKLNLQPAAARTNSMASTNTGPLTPQKSFDDVLTKDDGDVDEVLPPFPSIWAQAGTMQLGSGKIGGA